MKLDITLPLFLAVSFMRQHLARDGDGEGVAEGSTPDAVPRSDRPAR